MGENEQAIRERAHRLWEKRGGGEGEAEQDWLEAERQLHEERRSKSTSQTSPARGDDHAAQPSPATKTARPGQPSNGSARAGVSQPPRRTARSSS